MRRRQPVVAPPTMLELLRVEHAARTAGHEPTAEMVDVVRRFLTRDPVDLPDQHDPVRYAHVCGTFVVRMDERAPGWREW